jgi:hypothetical protein
MKPDPRKVGKIDSGAAREALAAAAGYGAGSNCCSNDTVYFIQDLLIAEIRRQRLENFHLRQLARNYLSVLEAEKNEQSE